MLPRLEAQHELASINAMAIAFGGMNPADRQRYLSRLTRAANGLPARSAPRPTPEALAAMGIAVVVEPPASAVPGSGQEADHLGEPGDG